MYTDPHAMETLRHTLTWAWHGLESTDNVGRSDNRFDVYYLLDYVAFSVTRAYPSLLCRAGCSGCCIEGGVPPVTEGEWSLIREHMDTVLDSELVARIRERAERDFRAALPAFQADAPRLTSLHGNARTPQAQDEFLAQLPCRTCPFLEDDRCTIYAVRPAICRSFGLFQIRRGGTLYQFTCAMSDADIRQHRQGTDDWLFPLVNKYLDRVVELNPPGAAIRYLPHWLLESVAVPPTRSARKESSALKPPPKRKPATGTFKV